MYEKEENPFQQPICTLSTADNNRKNKKQVLTPNSKGKEKEEEDIDDRLKTIFILSIDSGGARVTIPLLILEYIEEQVRRKFHQDISITECLDLIAGTSSSSISVLGLASINSKRENKRYTAREVSELYKDSLEYLYPPKGFLHSILRMHYNSYDSSNFDFFLEKFFQDSSSKDNSLKDLHTPIFIPAYDLDGNNIYCFDSEEAKTPSKNFLLKDVALAASADPTYQNPVEISSEAGEKYHFISGIFHAQNPSLLALKKAKEIYPDAKNLILISLGTGSIAQPPHHYGKLNKAGLLLWLTPIIDIIWNSNTQFQEYLIDQGESVIKGKDDSIKYIRINPELPIENSNIDNTSESNMDILRGIARKCFNKSTDEGKKIETIIQYFVDYLKEQGYKTISENTDLHSLRIKQLIKNAMGNNKLELINREISNSDVYFINEVMSELKNHLSIEILDLSNNKINEFGIRNIAFLMRQYPGLTKLILNDNQIGDVGVNLISTFFIKTHLTYLEIENCGITDAGLFSVASFLEKMPDLECINIRRNKVSPKTILLFINNEKIKW
ncbi:hypothetical protein IM40_09730 (plasmid) [Candidatus Paracaedimonas acanthamoebae]|nr:hypothetical protein IM40_09730 [Candidatus Paracaedimonas acanthamoebae]